MSNLKISVGGPDSRLLGGVVADKLVAASTVKVLLSNVRQFTLIFKRPKIEFAL